MAGYRTLWISDLHLGRRESRAGELPAFLATASAERIYLAGDIVDVEQMRSRSRVPYAHVDVIARLGALARSGTDVIYIPGNCDRHFRRLAGGKLCGIPVEREVVHETTDGKRLLVVHGDVLDSKVREGMSLGEFKVPAYSFLKTAELFHSRLERRLRRDHLPICSGIRRRLAQAERYIARFERLAVQHAVDRGFDGIVCGHLHKPTLRVAANWIYANDGDWVEHRSALAETKSGTLEILTWPAPNNAIDPPPGIATPRERPPLRRVAG